MRLRSLLALALLVAAAAPGAAAGAARVSIFYYPWYGTPEVDGAYQHWQQRGYRLPGQLASAFYPARGLYSSSDRLVVGAQMREIRAAGIDQVSSSWWGRGSPEDRRLAMILEEARAAGLDVAIHLEPYRGRTLATTEEDVLALRTLGVSDFHVYRPDEFPAAEWAALNARLLGVYLFAQTSLVGFAAAAGFDGLYTYDVLSYGGASFARLCAQARRRGLLCAPSVGPGYDARRAVGDPRVKPRRSGRTYDGMWRAAIRARPDLVTITSYNEWHEGTQIEPARPHRGPNGGRYLGYDGAWGRTGRAAQTAYLDRTAFWARRLARVG